MNRGLEFEGKNVKIAIEKACSELNLSQGNIKYDVISNGSSGIFGLVGVKKARIRVFVDATPKAASDAALSDNGIKNLVDEAFNGYQKSKPGKSSVKPAHNNKNKTNATANKAPREIRRPEPKPNKVQDESSPLEDHPENNQEAVISEDVLKLGTDALQKILDLITTGATALVEQKGDKLLFNVQGGNSGVLIGKRGQNLEAIQYIIDKIINKHNEKRVRVRVDVEGYLESRKLNLIKLAEKLAEKTQKTGKPSTIGQMNAQDRRTVHIALKHNKAVRTQSIGNGYYRKLVIFPKKNTHKRRKQEETASAE